MSNDLILMSILDDLFYLKLNICNGSKSKCSIDGFENIVGGVGLSSLNKHNNNNNNGNNTKTRTKASKKIANTGNKAQVSKRGLTHNTHSIQNTGYNGTGRNIININEF